MPGIGSYNPTFEGRKSFSKKKKGYSEWGKVERFGRSKSGNNLGPGSYLKGDEDKALVRTNVKSIYYWSLNIFRCFAHTTSLNYLYNCYAENNHW